MSIVISVEHLSKVYRLGQIGTGTLTHDMKLWWAKMRGKPNPLLKIGEQDHGNRDGATIWALKDVSFKVEQGEVLGIIGRNGAGKSTLLKILSRVTAPTSGRITGKGRVASLLEVGTGFHPELSGRENIYLNGAILGMKRDEITRKFDEIVDFSEVEKFVDTPVKRYSSGMYVRLAFAVAAHLEPEILVVDEVLAVGDAAFQRKCLGKMGDVARQGRTVLFVSHNMSAISSLTKNCLWIREGKVKQYHQTEDVIRQYLEDISASSDEGVADLVLLPRPSGIISPKVKFTTMRTLNLDGNPKSIFAEEDPIIFEFGFEILKATRNIQFGLGITSIKDWVELFTLPSNIYSDMLIPGNYQIQVCLDPNILKARLYTTAIKLFADGIRQDTLSHVVNFTIIKKTQSNNNKTETLHAPWISGPLRVNYPWSSIQSTEKHEPIR
jgi:lipopolysaccharide transport system ATP-binding protein